MKNQIEITQNNCKLILSKRDGLYTFKTIIGLKDINNADRKLLIEKFKNAVTQYDIKIMSFDVERFKIINKFLGDCDMNVYSKKYFYRKELKGNNEKNNTFKYEPSSSISEIEFLELFTQVSKGDIDVGNKPKEYLEEMIEMADFNYNRDNWKIVTKDNKRIGIVCPQLYPDDTKEGSIFYIGVMPKERNKGYGRIIHSDGIAFLEKMGAIKYVGSTTIENIEMQKIFKINKTELQYCQLYYEMKKN